MGKGRNKVKIVQLFIRIKEENLFLCIYTVINKNGMMKRKERSFL